MRALNEYMAMPYQLIIVPDKDEGGYAAYYPDLPGCITCADTYDKVMYNAVDAKREWLKAAMEDGYPIKEIAVSPRQADPYQKQAMA